MRVPHALAAMILAAGLSSVAVPAAADPVLYPCVGAPADEPAGGLYPQQREYVVWQSWWTFDAAGSPQSHVHGEACLPERETLDAAATPSLDVNVKVVLHDNPGLLTYSSMVFKGTDYETTVQKVTSNLTCPVPGVCSAWQAFSAPLSLFGHTGLQEVRFRTFIPQPKSPSGAAREMRNNLNFQLTITGTGKSLANVSREPWLRGKGWYTSPFLYCEATAVDADPTGPGLIPDAPVSGTWAPVVKQVTHSSDGSLPVTHVFATLDANFHAVPPVLGTVLWDHDGDTPQQAVPIDTTTLANGLHKLLLKTSCHSTALESGTNEGVLVLPFVVAN